MKSPYFKIGIGVLIGILILLFTNQSYRLRGKIDLLPGFADTLTFLGEKALLTNDVPVAAILTYCDTIIGVGYNTVRRDNNLGGHAEINALGDAFSNFRDDFNKLDRSKLVLYSTFEPCEMCKGAMVHYNIRYVRFEQKKVLKGQTKSKVKQLLYELQKRRFNAPDLQENLFLKHPDYPKNKQFFTPIKPE